MFSCNILKANMWLYVSISLLRLQGATHSFSFPFSKIIILSYRLPLKTPNVVFTCVAYERLHEGLNIQAVQCLLMHM